MSRVRARPGVRGISISADVEVVDQIRSFQIPQFHFAEIELGRLDFERDPRSRDGPGSCLVSPGQPVEFGADVAPHHAACVSGLLVQVIRVSVRMAVPLSDSFETRTLDFIDPSVERPLP